MSKAVAVKEESAVAHVHQIQNQAKEMAQAMSDTGIDVGDLEIPKVMLMQNTSEFVSDNLARLGDIVNTMSMEVLGGFEKPVEMVPLKLYKTLRIYDISGSEPKFMREEPLNAENAKLPWEGNEGGTPIKRMTHMNYFILLKKEMDEDSSFPLVVSFKSTGIQAGKQLATHLFKKLSLNQLPYADTVMLTSTKEKKGTNTYAVFGIGKGQKLSEKGLQDAQAWLARLASMNYRVAATDEPTVLSVDTGSVTATTTGFNELY